MDALAREQRGFGARPQREEAARGARQHRLPTPVRLSCGPGVGRKAGGARRRRRLAFPGSDAVVVPRAPISELRGSSATLGAVVDSEPPLASEPPISGGPVSRSVVGSTIVVADDDRITRELLSSMLRANGFVVEAVEDGQAAVERVGRGDVDLVLLDILMPRLSGLEACRLLKGMTTETFLPVVLVTVKTDTQSRVEGLRIGADDYVCKPFDERELIARVEAMLRIKKLHDHVVRARAKLEQLSVHDDLTGLYNYRYLHTRLAEEFKRAERYHDPLACIVLDIDRLQAINDSDGRSAGDTVIKGVAEAIGRTVRDVDVVARFGGDEFLVVLPSTHFAGSVTVAERIWRSVSERPFFGEGSRPFRVTLSVGVALYPSRDVRSKDALLRASDAALHHAKRDGGNRICVFQQHGYLYTPVVGEGTGEPLPSERPGTPRSNPPPAGRRGYRISDRPPSSRRGSG
ncbi:MAG: diguanylate cyclase [Polyangiaceae bacterium]|nr:diguanylate cyclase [Polyangiaceae bacterium]